MSDDPNVPNVFGKRAKNRTSVTGGVSAIKSAAHLKPEPVAADPAPKKPEPKAKAEAKSPPKEVSKKKKKPSPQISDDLVEKLARKSAEAAEKKLVNTSIRVEEKMITYIKAYAFKAGVQPAEVYRLALKRFFDDPEVIATLMEE